MKLSTDKFDGFIKKLKRDCGDDYINDIRDELVYKLYGLTDEEIKVVESK